MITVLLALIASLGTSLGGQTGALINQLVGIIGTATNDVTDYTAFIVPWVQYVNAIVDAKRDPTQAEHDAIKGLADAIHSQNQALASGTPVDQLPALPLPPSV